jgi:DNA topoisomerase-1
MVPSNHIDLFDQRLASIVRRCQELPGQERFQFLDGDGTTHAVGSEDANEYLRAIAGAEITAKPFRAWAGTNLAALALRKLESFDSESKAKSNVVRAVEAVSKMLGNTPTIWWKCYIHRPYLRGILMAHCCRLLKKRADTRLANPCAGLKADEAAMMGFLSRQPPSSSTRA